MDLRLSDMDVQRPCGSASAGELDIDMAGGRGVQAEGCVREKSVTTDKFQDVNELGKKGSFSLPDDFELENSESPHDKFDPLATKPKHDQETMQPPLIDKDCQGEMHELGGNYFHKSSFQFMVEDPHSERGTEDSAHSQESPITIDDNQTEITEGNLNLYTLRTTPFDEEINIFQEKSCQQESEPKNDEHYSRKSPAVSMSMADVSHSHPDSSKVSPQRSAPPPTARHMSVSPEKSYQIYQCTDRHGTLSSEEGMLEASYPPAALKHRKSSTYERSSRYRHRESSSPKRSDQAKEVPSRDHLSLSAINTSASSLRSQPKDGSPQICSSPLPKFHRSARKYGRPEKLVSRSPVRHRDFSSGYKRERHHRSRSRSPCKRDRRRSPRGRYSPRPRSSPSAYHLSHHSSHQRPWVPPPNRRTGLGKPGNILFIAGFNFLTTERDLERKFSRFGHVRDVRIVRDKRSGDSRGFGFITMERDEDADATIRALDETEWNGRIILVEKSKSH